MDKVTVAVWEKLAAGQGWGKVSECETWTALSVEPRFNKPGPWSLSVPWGSQAASFSKDRLVTFDARGFRVTCLVDKFAAASDEQGQPILTVSGVEALSLIGDALGWPTPGNTLAEQRSVRYYVTGAAESVLRSFVKLNMDRLGYEMVFPASLGRGSTITVNSAFDNVLAIVTEKATLAGLRVRTGLVNTTSSTRADLRTWFETPEDVSRQVVLSHAAGTVRSWSQEDAAPTATRVLVQAAKERQGREVASVSVSSNSITTAGTRKTSSRKVDSVNVTANSITTVSAHDMSTGDRVRFTEAGHPPAPLTENRDYYAVKVDSNTIKVASTRARANSGDVIGLTSAGSGDITLQRITYTNIENKLRTGDIVTFTGGTPPAPLEQGVAYHAIRVDSNTFKVAMTRANAAQGVAVNLEDEGAGTITVTEETRRYRQVTRPEAEALWSRKRETLLTASGEDSNAVLDEQASQALLDSAGESSFELDTVETDGMRPLADYVPGDLVTVQLLDDVAKTVPVGAFKVTADAESGVTIQTVPGDPDATKPLLALARIIRGLKRQTTKAQED